MIAGRKEMESSSLLPAQFLDDIEQQLNRFHERTGVTLVLFIDDSGQLISYKGDAKNLDLTALAALVAGDMSAISEIARLIGEKEKFKLLFHEGETFNILTSTIMGSYFLVSLFRTNVQIGLVRLFSKETIHTLQRLIEQIEITGDRAAPIVDVDFATSLADKMERAFGE
jgi:predicted regulator of Ras-like GTPase activity (Roadblock/LC7/MglB family)